MTQEEYDKLARESGLTPPSQLEASAPLAQPISDPSSFYGTVSGRPTPSVASPSNRGGSMTLAVDTTPAPPIPQSDALNKLIDYQIKQRTADYNQQQTDRASAYQALQNIDATPEQIDAAHATLQAPKVSAPFGEYQNGRPITVEQLKGLIPGYDDLTKNDQSDAVRQVMRDAYVGTITPDVTPQEAQLKQAANLGSGTSWRALQDLGIQYPGVKPTDTYKGTSIPIATVSQFMPDIPDVQKAPMVSGQPGYPPIPAQPIQKPGQVGQADSNIGLTTVRGTEFGEVDRPSRGGYTESNWNIGARGADLSGWNNEGVALPFSVLNKYGNTNDKDFIDKFNAGYEVQVVDPKTGKTTTTSLKDYGPGKSTGAGIDMLAGTRNNLGLPVNFSGDISYRIVPRGTSQPANTTASVQQQQTQQQNQDIASGQFAKGDNPSEVYIQPLDAKTRTSIRDPSIYGRYMGNDELLKYARVQADDYASGLASAGTPLDTKEYQATFKQFYDSALKYKDASDVAKPPPQEYLDQFSSLAGLVSPTAAQNPEGTKMSQIDLIQDLKTRLAAAGPGVGGAKTDEARMFDAQKNHLIANLARGLFGQKGNLSEQEQKAAAEGIPDYWDSDKSAQFKTGLLRSAIQDKMRQIINLSKAQHFDTTALEAEYRRIYVPSQAQQNAARQGSINQSAKNIQGAASGGASSSPSPPPNQNQVAPPPVRQPTFDTQTNQVIGAGLNPWGF